MLPDQAGNATGVRLVHLVFKTHLDIGFTALAREVVARYFEHYIPQAIALAAALRETGGAERFVWTTGSWLIYEYLEQASPAERFRLEEAIRAGDVCWHGLPFSTHSELLDPSLFEFGLGLSRELDLRFGKHTIAAKMTDVPGHTRAIVPLLARAGIQFLHIGVNPACRAPAVPPLFVWQDPSGAQVIVMYQSDYGYLALLPGHDEAIQFEHTGDNLGPPSIEQVVVAFRRARERFPNATVIASTMDGYAKSVLQLTPQLPRVTGEIGDAWIHGPGSDPGKVARYRTLCRLRREWLASGVAAPNDARLARLSRALLVIPEHTWSLDEKKSLADYTNYAAPEFRRARTSERFQLFEASWAEQRAYIDQAVAALDGSPLAAQARQALKRIEPVRPNLAAARACDPTATFETAHFLLRFDSACGGIAHLQEKTSGRVWVDGGGVLAGYWYQTFAQEDYDRFWRQFLINKRATRAWSRLDFTKPGIAQAGAVACAWLPRLDAFYEPGHPHGRRFTSELTMPERSWTEFGAPRVLTLDTLLPDDEAAVYLTLQWFEKPACRLPEAHWLSFRPVTPDRAGWRLDKMGEQISPLEVVRNGNRKLHAVDRGVTYRDQQGCLQIETLDAPLVAPGRASLLDFNNLQPPVREGVHVNLYNNVAGTNFPMWYDEDACFRLVLRFAAGGEQ